MTLTIYQHLKTFSQIYVKKNQEIFEFFLEKLLQYKFTRFVCLYWIKMLFYFHFFWAWIYDRVGVSNMNVSALLISFICSRLHIAGYLIIICLILLRLITSFRQVAKFYQKDMTRLSLHFPEWQNDKRYMRKTAKMVTEALEDPKVQAVTAAVIGACAWKAIDVWDTHKSAEIAAQDREAEYLRHREILETEVHERQQDREAEAHERQQDREAEYLRHREILEAEATKPKEIVD